MQEKSQILFCKILKNKCYHAKVLPKTFYFNGHTAGFHPQTQKLDLLYVSITDSENKVVKESMSHAEEHRIISLHRCKTE